MKIMAGLFFLASWNRDLTLAAPTPTKICTKSDPDTKKKGTPASPAVALANIVLPVPGGPVSKAPLGILAPNSWYLSGFFKKSTNYWISSLLSCIPATLLNLTLECLVMSNFCLLTLSPCIPFLESLASETIVSRSKRMSRVEFVYYTHMSLLLNQLIGSYR